MLSVRTFVEGGGEAKPTTPVLSLAHVSVTSVSLTWTTSNSDSEIITYQIGRNGMPYTPVDGATTQFTDNQVVPDTRYEYYVVARDSELQDRRSVTW